VKTKAARGSKAEKDKDKDKDKDTAKDDGYVQQTSFSCFTESYIYQYCVYTDVVEVVKRDSLGVRYSWDKPRVSGRLLLLLLLLLLP